jgi:Outer membrane protein beta-barrel domain
MQSRLLSLAIAVGVLAAAPLSARSQSTSSATTYTIGANAGLVIPVSDLADLTSSGYTIAATLGMHQALSPLSFRVEGSFTELPWKNEIAQGAKHRIYGFALDGQYNLGTPSTNGGLYVTGGVGYFGTKDTDIPTFTFGPTETSTTWDIGINAGLGYYLPLSGFTVYFEGRYRNIFSDTHQAMFPITVGIAF